MKKLIVFIALLTAIPALAQQEIMVSQYMFNGLFLNPAYSGTHPYFRTSMLYRTQWVNFDGAPETQILAVDGPVSKEKMGVGMIISHDKIGVTDETNIFGNYSYKLKFEKSTLCFGIKAGVSSYKARLTSLSYWDRDDQVFNQDINRSLIPKFGFGAFYYGEHFYAGLSVPTLLAYDRDYNFNFDLEKASYFKRNYFLNGGYVFDIDESFKLKPSFLVKYLPYAPAQLDVNVSTMYRNMITLGFSYRTGDAVTGILEYQANQRFRVGYAFDYTTSTIRNYSSGTHEIMIGYDFGKEVTKMKTPRFF